MKVRAIKRRAYAQHAHTLQLRQYGHLLAQSTVRKLNQALAASIAKMYEPLLLIIRTMGDVLSGGTGGATTASFSYRGGLA